MKINLQMFAEAVHGKRIVYLYRILEEAATVDGAALAFTTENERSKSKDSDSTATKDGPVLTPGEVEQEVTATSLLAKGDTLVERLEDALDNNKIVEVWEANLDDPAGDNTNKFNGRYMQGYLTEISRSSSAEDYVEISLTFGINGAGVKGEVTVSAEQQEVAAYVFADTKKTGA